MKAVLVEVPPSLLEERRRRGDDMFDEMWEGVLHMNPPPKGDHQQLGSELFLILGPVAKTTGLDPWYETGLYNHPKDWRVPDLSFSRPEHRIEAGISSAELVVEIRSPGDETYDKLDWYIARGVAEVLVIDPATRSVELFRNVENRLMLAQPDDKGWLKLTTLPDVRLARVDMPDGPRLSVVTGDSTVEL